MIARKRGKIINIASLASEVARKTIGPYTAAKGGVRQLTKTMCVEWAEHNIQANAIGPGYFRTELNTRFGRIAAFNKWVDGPHAGWRWGEPEELIGVGDLPLLGRVRFHERADGLCRRRVARRDVGRASTQQRRVAMRWFHLTVVGLLALIMLIFVVQNLEQSPSPFLRSA